MPVWVAVSVTVTVPVSVPVTLSVTVTVTLSVSVSAPVSVSVTVTVTVTLSVAVTVTVSVAVAVAVTVAVTVASPVSVPVPGNERAWAALAALSAPVDAPGMRSSFSGRAGPSSGEDMGVLPQTLAPDFLRAESLFRFRKGWYGSCVSHVAPARSLAMGAG